MNKAMNPNTPHQNEKAPHPAVHWTVEEWSSWAECLKSGRLTRIEKAGEGNMNLTLRGTFESEQTVILKHSPPYCFKYPTIPAPSDRLAVESAFYRSLERHEYGFTPRVLAYDSTKKIIALEDLGLGADFSDCYPFDESPTSLDRSTLTVLAQHLKKIHQVSISKLSLEDQQTLENRNMRKLNHEYIFDLPLQTPGPLDLDSVTPGLETVALELKNDPKFQAAAQSLGKEYLHSNERVLCHGDYYPMSWLRVEAELFVIDPEFAYIGTPAFDLGNFFAHLIFVGCPAGDVLTAVDAYEGSPTLIQQGFQFAGTELMRRLMSVSQLPVKADLGTKKNWLNLARTLVLHPERFDKEIR